MSEPQVLTFAEGLVGVPAAQHFVLVRVDDAMETGLFTLRCLDDLELQFVVADPGRFFPAYAPLIDDATCDRLELTQAEDAVLLVVLTVGDGPKDTTGNLLAPLVVHTGNLKGAQAVLTEGPWGTKVPLGV